MGLSKEIRKVVIGDPSETDRIEVRVTVETSIRENGTIGGALSYLFENGFSIDEASQKCIDATFQTGERDEYISMVQQLRKDGFVWRD